MARRGSRKWKRQMATLAVIGAVGVVFILWLFTQIPWDGVSVFVFSIVLVAVLGFAANELFRRLKLEVDKKNRFDKASEVNSTGRMNHMSPTEFEHYVAALFEAKGYKTTVTKQSGDGGIDIILESRDGRGAVQVKRYKDTYVGRPEVQKLVGASYAGFNKRYVVTSSDFTAEAREYAAEHGVTLINGQDILKMAEEIYGTDHKQKTFSFAFQQRMTR